MFESMNEIFKIVENNQPELLSQHLRSLPDSLQKRYNKDGIRDNVFGLYCSYLDMNRPFSYDIRNKLHGFQIEEKDKIIDNLKREHANQANLSSVFVDL